MCRIKNYKIVCLVLIGAMFCSCNNTVKKLTNMFGKELSAPQGHLFSPSKLVINKDSSFEYKEGGPVLKYSKGTWVLVKSNVILKSSKELRQVNKQLVDTVFLNLD